MNLCAYDLLNLPEETIRRRLEANDGLGMIPPAYLSWRRAAVLLSLLAVDGAWHVLYIRRTEIVSEHKGQVAFPGGSMEPEDASLEITALRETAEEIGVQPGHVRILGHMPDFFTITNYLIRPVVGIMDWPLDLTISADEVDRVFTIPLGWLADPNNYDERPWPRPNGDMIPVIFYHPYDGEVLWGATARMTLDFVQLLSN